MKLEIKQVNNKVAFKLNDEKLSNDSALWSYDTVDKFSRSMWKDVQNLFNGDTGVVNFIGEQTVYEGLSKLFPDGIDNISLMFTNSETQQNKTFESKLDKWLTDLLATDLLDDGTKATVKKRFTEVSDNVFVVNVLARVSAGKSTLINSLLGRELLPSNNNAETAKITQILDNDKTDGFSAVALDANQNDMYHVKKLSPEKMDELNDDDDVNSLKLHGDIPFAKAIDYSLELVDTPGPDNVMNEKHHVQFDQLISRQNKNGFKPVVVYIIPSDAIGTTTTDDLLNVVKEESEVDAQSAIPNRFIFVISKMDAVKPKNVAETMENAKKYLMAKGIENPVIIPVSAELALQIRDSSTLDEDDLEDLKDAAEKQNRRPEYHFDEIAVGCKSNTGTVVGDDAMASALLHSGILTLENEIQFYINKYAAPARLTRLDIFTNHILFEATQTTNIAEQLAEQRKALAEVKKQVDETTKTLDEETKTLQAKRLIDIKVAKKNVQSLLSDSKGNVTSLLDVAFENYQPKNNKERSQRLKEIFDGLVTKIMDGLSTLEDNLQNMGHEYQFELPDGMVITAKTRQLIQHGLNQCANITVSETNRVSKQANARTVSFVKDYCIDFQDEFIGFSEPKLLQKLEQAQHQLAEQIDELNDDQREQQSLLDTLIQKQSGLEEQVRKLTLAKQLLDAKPALKENSL